VLKKLLFIALVTASTLTHSAPVTDPYKPFEGLVGGCPISSSETLVCSVILCNPLGMSIAAAVPACTAVNLKFAIYLATLGPFDSPPKCKARDKSCNVTGRASNAEMSPEYCYNLSDKEHQDACTAALGAAPVDYCDKFTDYRKDACIVMQTTGTLPLNFCDAYALTSEFSSCLADFVKK